MKGQKKLEHLITHYDFVKETWKKVVMDLN